MKALSAIFNRDPEERAFETFNIDASLEEPGAPKFARATIWALVTGLVAFLIWAAVTPVYEVVSGTGQIRPAAFVQQAEHLEGGIVARIHVAEGDPVTTGDLLVTLDNTTILTELTKARGERLALVQQLNRSTALLTGAGDPALPEDPALAAEGSLRAAQVGVIRSQRQVELAELDALAATIEGITRELKILKSRRERLSGLGDNALVRKSELENAERETVRLQSEILRLNAEKVVRRAAINRFDAQEAELLASFNRDTTLLQESLQNEIAVLDQTITQLENLLERVEIRAPATGIVQALSVQNPGQVLGAGEAVAEIVPSDGQLFAEVEISADKISGIGPGRVASLKVLTHDFTRFGDVEATVTQVSPTSIIREDGSAVFRVRLELSQTNIGGGIDKRRQITAGMTITADIRTDQRVVLSYLLKPVRVIADRALSES